MRTIGAHLVSIIDILYWSLLISQGAFVAAPFGGLLWAFGACGLRISFLFVMSKIRGQRFDAFDRPMPRHIERPGALDEQENETVLEHHVTSSHKGKFF
jgi:hypothetical protein